jgi:hypothetical protein
MEWGHSSVGLEQPPAERQVIGSNPIAPFIFFAAETH